MLGTSTPQAALLGSHFIYQGQFKQDGALIDGCFDRESRRFEPPTQGLPVAAPQTSFPADPD